MLKTIFKMDMIINNQKLQNKGFFALENDMQFIKSKIKKTYLWNLIKTSFLMDKFTILTVL